MPPTRSSYAARAMMYEQMSEEWQEWLDLTPLERFRRSEEIFGQYLAMGGTLDPDPIRRVLSTIQKNGVQALLMGGQVCVFYGAAQFSKDVDRWRNLNSVEDSRVFCPQ